MTPAQVVPLPAFFSVYIKPLPADLDLVRGLQESTGLFDAHLSAMERVADRRYAAGKWTPRDILQHVTDNERIQAYRALRIARNDKTPLPGYDENLLADNTTAASRSAADLVEEFKLVRRANIMLFSALPNDMLQRHGNCNGIDISVLALGFVLIGHAQHHLNILQERYFPL